MTIIHKIIKGGSDFLSSIKRDNKKQLVELERLEKQIEDLKEKEKVDMTTQGIGLTNRTSLKFWLIGIFAVFIAYLIYQSLSILFLIMTAFIISVAIEAIVDFFQRKLSHRGIAIAIAYIGLLIFIIGGGFFIVPFILSQLSNILTIVTNNITGIQATLSQQPIVDIVSQSHRIPGAVKKAILDMLASQGTTVDLQVKLQDNIAQLVNVSTSYAREIGNFAVNFISGFVSFIAKASIVLTLSVLFSIQKNSVMKFIAGLGGEKQYKFVYMRLEKIYRKLGIWLKSQLFLCLCIGVAFYAAMWIASLFGMDIPTKGSLAIIGGITELIPYAGPILGGFVMAVVAFMHYGIVGAAVFIGIVVLIQRLEGNILVPLVMTRTLGVNPIIIFISMILGGLIMGVVGVLLAVPIAVIITMVFEKTFDE